MNITEEQEMIEYWQSKMKEQEYPSDYGGEDFWKASRSGIISSSK